MAWSDPTANLTWVNAEVATHTKLNLIRDDLLETAPAKATTAGGYFVATAANTIAERVTGYAVEGAEETTTSNTFTDLATAGPAVTVTTGTQVIVMISAEMKNATNGNTSYAGLDVSGATTTAATLIRAASSALTQHVTAAKMFIETVTAGSNTLTVKYRTTGGTTATFDDRMIVAVPL